MKSIPKVMAPCVHGTVNSLNDATGDMMEEKFVFKDPLNPYSKIVVSHRLYARTSQPQLAVAEWEGQLNGMMNAYLKMRQSTTEEKSLFPAKPLPTLDDWVEEKK